MSYARQPGVHGGLLIRPAVAAMLLMLLGGCGFPAAIAKLLGNGPGTEFDPAQASVTYPDRREPIKTEALGTLAQAPTSSGVRPGRQRSAKTEAQEVLAQAPVSNDVLAQKRGGIMIHGIDFKFGLSLFTGIRGGPSLLTNLNMNDNGRWIPALSQMRDLPQQAATPAVSFSVGVTPASTSTVIPLPANPSAPIASTKVSTTPPADTIQNAGGLANFQTVVGNPDTTQIIHELVGNSITTLVTNRVNNVSVKNDVTLDVTIRNAAQVSHNVSTFAHMATFAEQMSRFGLR